MASLAAVLSNAILKVSTMEPYNTMEFNTADEARENFTAALLFELGLGPKPAAVHAPVAVPKAADEPAKKAPKKRAAKKGTEAVVAEAAVAVLEQVKEKAPEVEALVEQMGQMALEEQPKPKKARKAPAASESASEKKDEEPAVATKKKPGPKVKAPHMGAGAGVPPPEDSVATKKKPGPKAKAKVEGANLEKLTPTQKKHLKAASVSDSDFTVWANGMPAEEWKAQTVDEHIRSFLEGRKPASPKVVETEFIPVRFNGKDYLIDSKTRFIYEVPPEGQNVKTKLGEVGEEPFEDIMQNVEEE